MKIIVCGAGQVGFNIARELAAEKNDVYVVDQSPELIKRISDSLEVRAAVGHGSHPDTLAAAGADDADMIIAVTYSDEVNMVACQVAHSIFNVPMKIARVRAQSYLDKRWSGLFDRENMPIDVIISPEIEVARSVLRRLESPGAIETMSFADDRLRVMGVHVTENCPIINTPLRQLTDLFPDLESVIVGIVREGRMMTASGDEQLIAGDDAYFVARREHTVRALSIFGEDDRAARRVVIIGGGNIGVAVAQELEKRGSSVRARLVEVDKARAERAADRLERTVVLNGDGLDQEILLEAGVHDAETVVALTDNDEVNILASVIAKKLGAGRTLALINKPDFDHLMGALSIDAFINPRTTTVSTILQHVRAGRIRALRSVRGGAAEVLEAEALETAPIVGKTLREANFGSGVLVGAILRHDDVIMPRSDTMILAGDRVVLFVVRDSVKRVERLFRVGLEYF